MLVDKILHNFFYRQLRQNLCQNTQKFIVKVALFLATLTLYILFFWIRNTIFCVLQKKLPNLVREFFIESDNVILVVLPLLHQ